VSGFSGREIIIFLGRGTSDLHLLICIFLLLSVGPGRGNSRKQSAVVRFGDGCMGSAMIACFGAHSPCFAIGRNSVWRFPIGVKLDVVVRTIPHVFGKLICLYKHYR